MKLELTKEQESINNANHKKAVEYFESIYPWFKNREPYEYDLHHKDETLRHKDINRYIEWRIEDLVIEEHAKHTSHHHKDKVTSEETKKKMSEAAKGRHISEETKKKISESLKGRESVFKGTKGVINCKSVICVETQEIFNSATEASLSINKKGNAVSTAIGKGHRCGGYHWRYVDNG